MNISLQITPQAQMGATSAGTPIDVALLQEAEGFAALMALPAEEAAKAGPVIPTAAPAAAGWMAMAPVEPGSEATQITPERLQLLSDDSVAIDIPLPPEVWPSLELVDITFDQSIEINPESGDLGSLAERVDAEGQASVQPDPDGLNGLVVSMPLLPPIVAQSAVPAFVGPSTESRGDVEAAPRPDASLIAEKPAFVPAGAARPQPEAASGPSGDPAQAGGSLRGALVEIAATAPRIDPAGMSPAARPDTARLSPAKAGPLPGFGPTADRLADPTAKPAPAKAPEWPQPATASTGQDGAKTMAVFSAELPNLTDAGVAASPNVTQQTDLALPAAVEPASVSPKPSQDRLDRVRPFANGSVRPETALTTSRNPAPSPLDRQPSEPEQAGKPQSAPPGEGPPQVQNASPSLAGPPEDAVSAGSVAAARLLPVDQPDFRLANPMPAPASLDGLQPASQTLLRKVTVATDWNATLAVETPKDPTGHDLSVDPGTATEAASDATLRGGTGPMGVGNQTRPAGHDLAAEPMPAPGPAMATQTSLSYVPPALAFARFRQMLDQEGSARDGVHLAIVQPAVVETLVADAPETARSSTPAGPASNAAAFALTEPVPDGARDTQPVTARAEAPPPAKPELLAQAQTDNSMPRTLLPAASRETGQRQDAWIAPPASLSALAAPRADGQTKGPARKVPTLEPRHAAAALPPTEVPPNASTAQPLPAIEAATASNGAAVIGRSPAETAPLAKARPPVIAPVFGVLAEMTPSPPDHATDRPAAGLPDRDSRPVRSSVAEFNPALAAPRAEPAPQPAIQPAVQPLAALTPPERPLRALPKATAVHLAQSVTHSGHSRAELVLEPSELGRIRFDLITQGDQVQINLMVERPETLDLLRANAEALRQEFRAAGLDTGSLNFSQWSQSGQERAAPDLGPEDLQPSVSLAPSVPARPARNISSTGLDLRL